VAGGGTNGVDQVTERIQGAAELAGGGKDRATVHLDRSAVSIRGRRDQDITAEHFRGRSACGMQRLLAEVLNLWSAAGSGAECGPDAGIGCRAAPAPRPPLPLRQLRSIEGETPSSLAIRLNGRPLLTSRATASRLNSSVKRRRPWLIRHLSAPAGA